MDQTQKTENIENISIENINERLDNLGNECVDWLNEKNPIGDIEDFCKMSAIFGYRAAITDITDGKFSK